jgi:hypothetical protein
MYKKYPVQPTWIGRQNEQSPCKLYKQTRSHKHFQKHRPENITQGKQYTNENITTSVQTKDSKQAEGTS